MNDDQNKELLDAIKAIADGIGWICFWLFFLTLASCASCKL